MTMQDPISDMLTRIRNAQKAHKVSVTMPSSKQKLSILSVLQDEGFIESFEEDKAAKPEVTVTLRYFKSEPVIRTIKRVSKPGLRIYKGATDVPKVANGLGVNIVSTSKGIMTDKKARSQNLGGEILCEVF